MSDIVTGTVTGQLDTADLVRDHGDIRREQASIGADAAYQNGVQHAGIVDAVKSAGWINSDRTGSEADRVVQQDTAYFIAAQSQNFANSTAIAALKSSTDASTAATLAAIQLSASQATAATALEGAKSAAASALGQAVLGQQIVNDGNATRALINTLKMEELNRLMTERQSEIIEERGNSRYFKDAMQNVQSNALSSQINALHSQFQAASQGTVNFGTMSGSAGSQAATNNSVR